MVEYVYSAFFSEKTIYVWKEEMTSMYARKGLQIKKTMDDDLFDGPTSCASLLMSHGRH